MEKKAKVVNWKKKLRARINEKQNVDHKFSISHSLNFKVNLCKYKKDRSLIHSTTLKVLGIGHFYFVVPIYKSKNNNFWNFEFKSDLIQHYMEDQVPFKTTIYRSFAGFKFERSSYVGR